MNSRQKGKYVKKIDEMLVNLSEKVDQPKLISNTMSSLSLEKQQSLDLRQSHERKKLREEKKLEGEAALIATRALEFLMNHYANAWKQGSEILTVESQLRVWMQALGGLRSDQVDYAKQKISRGECYAEFPPNPGLFRQLCFSMPVPSKAMPRVTFPDEKTPSPTPTFNPNYDIRWFHGLSPEKKTIVYQDALKAYPMLEHMLKVGKESALDEGLEKRPWFKPMIEAFRGYNRLWDL